MEVEIELVDKRLEKLTELEKKDQMMKDKKREKNKARRERKRQGSTLSQPIIKKQAMYHEELLCPFCRMPITELKMYWHIKKCTEEFEKTNGISQKKNEYFISKESKMEDLNQEVKSETKLSSKEEDIKKDPNRNEESIIERKCYITTCLGKDKRAKQKGVMRNSKYVLSILIGNTIFNICGIQHFSSTLDFAILKNDFIVAYEKFIAHNKDTEMFLETPCFLKKTCTKKGSSIIALRSYKGTIFLHYCSTSCLLSHLSTTLDKTWTSIVTDILVPK